MESISIIRTKKELKSNNGELIIVTSEKIENEDVARYVKLYSTKESQVYSINKEKELILFSKINSQNLDKIKDECSRLISHINSHYENSSFYINIKEFEENIQKELLYVIHESVYKFDKYLSEKKPYTNSLQVLTSIDDSIIKSIKIISQQKSYCKDLVNSNADEITSEFLHKELENFSITNNLKFKSIVGEELLDNNHNLHYAVGKGSKVPPRLLCAEYKGDLKSEDFIALVGKGVTFDTGGLNLKPTGAIEDMKIDMGGAATLFSTFKALVELKVKQNIILILGCCENVIDSHAYKVGDVITSRKGITVEVTNTDAEGRLVLADCLDYVQEKYSIKEVFDCATLTGACMVALGTSTAGVFTNNDELCNSFLNQTKESNENFWQLPITKEHREVLKSQIADCSNCGLGAKRRFGGASSAAAFLEKFIKENTKWVHLDIAGPCYDSKNLASGVAIRSLVEFYSK